MNHTFAPRLIDHLVLPVEDIQIARARYQALGFTVAPDGLHPFGTENCCVFFDDDTFLEPLGIAHRETTEAAAVKGNTFLINDLAFRFRRGQEGFSHLVIKSDDAKADARHFRQEGYSGGRSLRFSRRFKTPEGGNDKASFSLAFAADKRAPDAGFFACEVVHAPEVDRTLLKRHDNGALGLSEVVIAEPNPSDFQYFLQAFLNQREMDNNSFGIELATGNAGVTVLSPDGMRAFYGIETERQERGMRLSVFVVAVQNIAHVKEHLIAANIDHNQIGARIVVPPAPGQGTTMAFKEVSE